MIREKLLFINCDVCNVILFIEYFYNKYPRFNVYLLAPTQMMIKHFCFSTFRVFFYYIYQKSNIKNKYIMFIYEFFQH